MFHKAWEVLVVDDEPDVLQVSKLAMKSFEVYGRPLRIHSAESKAKAVALLETNADLIPALAVAFIDVVMETDTAGLDLCRYIREDRKNHLTQLFIRTGQPGIAPERTVIDRYDINGYFTKVEATEDKLYSLVKSGVRQYYWSSFALGGSAFLRAIVAAAGSRENLATTMQHFVSASVADRSGATVDSYVNVNHAFIIDNQVVGKIGWDDKGALAERDRLSRITGTALSPDGDSYVLDGNYGMLVKVAPGPHRAEAYAVATAAFPVPDFVLRVFYDCLMSAATLWHGAK